MVKNIVITDGKNSCCFAVLRGPGFGDERSYLCVLIGHLRKKLEDDVANPVYLLTDSHIEYRFREP